MAHELSHFVKDHHVSGFTHKSKTIKNKTKYNSEDEKLEEVFMYSKNQELEADEEGYMVYKKTNYSMEAVEGVFDMLLYSYLPIDEVEFQFSCLESHHMKLPADMHLEEINEISAVEDYDDKESTHPNILKRKENVRSLLKGNKKVGEEFIISEETFHKVQKIARYELSYLYSA